MRHAATSNGVEDIAAGHRALDALRRAAAHGGVNVDTEQAARNDRATRAAKRLQHITEQQQALHQLREESATLASSKPKTNGERQARAYQHEKLLADLSEPMSWSTPARPGSSVSRWMD